jgi:transcriptional regulator with XRE-family HTH domain
MISTGIKYLDRIIGGINLGDNLVWQIANAVPIEHFLKSFFNKSNDFQNTIIYVNFNYSPHTICKRFDDIFKNHNFLLVDAFTHGKGNSDQVFLDFYRTQTDYDPSRIMCIDDPRDIRRFIEIMNEIQKAHRDGSFYIFDSLTGMNELWKNERSVVDFFAFTCPKLYELNTIAYWIFEEEAHSKEFIAGLTHITQVLLSVYSINSDFFALKVLKLEDRPTTTIGTPYPFRIIDRTVSFDETAVSDVIKIGTKVKELRKLAGITQAELSSRLGMTPGAISQIENNIIAPSLNTLLHLAVIFQKPVEFFIDSPLLGAAASRGFSVFRKKNEQEGPSRKISITRLSEEKNLPLKPFYITIASRHVAEGPLLLHKGKEYIFVINGILNVTISGEEVILRKGDSILLEHSFAEKWSNHGRSECEFLYIQI